METFESFQTASLSTKLSRRGMNGRRNTLSCLMGVLPSEVGTAATAEIHICGQNLLTISIVARRKIPKIYQIRIFLSRFFNGIARLALGLQEGNALFRQNEWNYSNLEIIK